MISGESKLFEKYRHPCPKQYFWVPDEDETTLQMDLTKQALFIDNTNNIAATVYLPDVAEAMGMIYTISVMVDAANNITLSDFGSANAANWTDMTFTAVRDGACLMSDGKRWHIFVEITT